MPPRGLGAKKEKPKDTRGTIRRIRITATAAMITPVIATSSHRMPARLDQAAP